MKLGSLNKMFDMYFRKLTYSIVLNIVTFRALEIERSNNPINANGRNNSVFL